MDPTLFPTPFAPDFNTIITGGGDHGIVQVMDTIDQGIEYELAMVAYRIATAIEAKAMLRTMLERQHPNIANVLTNGKLEARDCYALVNCELPKMVAHLASNIDATPRAINMQHLATNLSAFRDNLARLYVHPERAPVLPNVSRTLSVTQRADVDHSRMALSFMRQYGLTTLLQLKTVQPYVDRARHVLEHHLNVDLCGYDDDSDNDDGTDSETDSDMLPPPPKRVCVEDEADESSGDEGDDLSQDPTTPERVPAAEQRIGIRGVYDITMSFFENKNGQ
jgi:hypothetical protein